MCDDVDVALATPPSQDAALLEAWSGPARRVASQCVSSVNKLSSTVFTLPGDCPARLKEPQSLSRPGLAMSLAAC